MTSFAEAIRTQSNLVRTEKGALAHTTTGSAVLDLFSSVGGLRNESFARISDMFGKALQEDALLAVKLMFYARNIRGGLGERDVFRKMLVTLADTMPHAVILNMELIPFFGRWDDLYVLEGTQVEETMWQFISHQLTLDLRNINQGKSFSLMAKWLKSVNASSQETVRLGRKTAFKLGLTEMAYRRILSTMRSALNVLEKSMTAREWDKIQYETVPSNAMAQYRKAFYRNDEVRFGAYIEAVKGGEKKINASTLYPYNILQKMNLSAQYFGSGDNAFSVTRDEVLMEQWKALPNYIEGENNILVMADTSGSMLSNEGLPLATSIGLAVYFAERNHGAYHNKMLTFSSCPSFVEFLDSDDLVEKIARIPAIIETTDLERAFDLILEVAIYENVPQEEMPVALLVISDMQFDESVRQGRNTFYNAMKKKFEMAGYTIPQIVFWNVADRRATYPTLNNTKNTVLVSGHSVSVFKSVMGLFDGVTPYDVMIKTLNDPMYENVRI